MGYASFAGIKPYINFSSVAIPVKRHPPSGLCGLWLRHSPKGMPHKPKGVALLPTIYLLNTSLKFYDLETIKAASIIVINTTINE